MGARFDVRTGGGLTADELERALRCHQARSVAGDLRSEESDPFSLADSWVDIRVQPQHGGFSVTVRGQTEEDSELIDSKARAYLTAASIEEGGYGSR